MFRLAYIAPAVMYVCLFHLTVFKETVAETLRPLAEGKEHHEESPTSAAGLSQSISGL